MNFQLVRRKREMVRRASNEQIKSEGKKACEEHSKSEGSGGRQFPGLPHHITPMLPRKDFQRLQSTGTFLVLCNTVSEDKYRIALYSLQTGACRQLPPIPDVENGIPQLCQCTTLDTKIYILGGLNSMITETNLDVRAEMYMLEVTAAHAWVKCASMHTARGWFGCGIIDGKIYVCGGFSGNASVSGTEVYDPKTDAWTELMPMPSAQMGHTVGVVKNELLVHTGQFFLRGHSSINLGQCRLGELLYRNLYPAGTIPHADDLQIYNPATGVWRTHSSRLRNHPFRNDRGYLLFVVEGKLHSITGCDVFQTDLDKNIKNHLHSIEQRKIDQWTSYIPDEPLAALAVGEHLFAFDDWHEYQSIERSIERDQSGDGTIALLHTTGFERSVERDQSGDGTIALLHTTGFERSVERDQSGDGTIALLHTTGFERSVERDQSGDGTLALLHTTGFERSVERDQSGDRTLALLHATGFDIEGSVLVWERILPSLSFAGLLYPFLHIIRVQSCSKCTD